MANLKFGFTNLLMSGAASLKSGTGGGAPALIETAPYVMANLLVNDRYTFWKSSLLTHGVQYSVDFDLGSGQSVGCAALEGFRLASGTGPFVDVSYQVSSYTPASGWIFAGSIVNLFLQLRDDAVEFSPVTARYWRFTFTIGGVDTILSLGKFFLGVLTDLGAKHSPGAIYHPMGNRQESSLLGGAVVLIERGDDGAEFRIPWNVAAPAVESAFLTMQGLPGSHFMVWPTGNFYEIYLKGRELNQTRGFQNDYELVLGRVP